MTFEGNVVWELTDDSGTLVDQGHVLTAMGSWQHKMVFDDNWTAITTDGKRTAQYEHTILVTEDGFDVLTAPGAVSPSAPWNR